MRKGIVSAAKLSTDAYLSALLGWYAARLCFGDRWWWLFLLNVGALYLLVPLPLALLGALRFRRIERSALGGIALGLALYLYGSLFLPRQPLAHARTAPLTVMTYNALFHQTDAPAVVAALRASGADLIALQELNEPVAAAIRQGLAEQYPYQLLEPSSRHSGMGVISRFPLDPTGEQLPGRWLGTPQVLRVDLGGTTITLVNVHCISINMARERWQQNLERAARERERQARTLAELAARRAGPLLVLGDFNTTDQTAAYRTLTGALADAWREGGRGLGHTFPGPFPPLGAGSSGAGWPSPAWLARIDYIFHSPEWRTLSAWNGPETGRSDHRPVVAELTLRQSLCSIQHAKARQGLLTHSYQLLFAFVC